MPLSKRVRHKRRLLRQFAVMERRMPVLHRPIEMLLGERGTITRVTAGILLMIGGLFAVLPFLGLWMIPLGLLLLAVDVPLLRPTASAVAIKGRRWANGKARQVQAWRAERS